MRWRHHEPFFWLVFGAGGLLGALCLPALVLVLGLALPISGSDGAFAYERALDFARDPVSGVSFVLLVTLLAMHAAHHVYHGMLELGLRAGRVGRILTYGSALLVGVSSAALLLRL